MDHDRRFRRARRLARAGATALVLACATLASAAPRAESQEPARPRASQEECDAGNDRACSALATLHWSGDGAPRDHARALQLASGPCARGDAAGCETIRLLFTAGDDAARPGAGAALATLERGCVAGALGACAAIAVAYQEGFGVKQDRDRALALAERACSGAAGPGCRVAGELHRVRGDRDRAREAFAQGCLLGSAPACLDVAQRELEPASSPFTFRVLVDLARRHQPLNAFELLRTDRALLRVLRNTVYASRGQRFEAADLRAFFSGFDWYAPRGRVEDGSLDAQDRRNLALVKAAEARPPVPPADAGGDARLVAAIADTDHAAPPLSGEERALAGSWRTQSLGPPNEPTPLPDRHERWELLENRRVVHWVDDDCHDPVAAQVGFWEARGEELHVRWFAELRYIGGSMLEESRCAGAWDAPPALRALAAEEVIPTGGEGQSRTFRGVRLFGP